MRKVFYRANTMAQSSYFLSGKITFKKLLTLGLLLCFGLSVQAQQPFWLIKRTGTQINNTKVSTAPLGASTFSPTINPANAVIATHLADDGEVIFYVDYKGNIFEKANLTVKGMASWYRSSSTTTVGSDHVNTQAIILPNPNVCNRFYVFYAADFQNPYTGLNTNYPQYERTSALSYTEVDVDPISSSITVVSRFTTNNLKEQHYERFKDKYSGASYLIAASTPQAGSLESSLYVVWQDYEDDKTVLASKGGIAKYDITSPAQPLTPSTLNTVIKEADEVYDIAVSPSNDKIAVLFMTSRKYSYSSTQYLNNVDRCVIAPASFQAGLVGDFFLPEEIDHESVIIGPPDVDFDFQARSVFFAPDNESVYMSSSSAIKKYRPRYTNEILQSPPVSGDLKLYSGAEETVISSPYSWSSVRPMQDGTYALMEYTADEIKNISIVGNQVITNGSLTDLSCMAPSGPNCSGYLYVSSLLPRQILGGWEYGTYANPTTITVTTPSCIPYSGGTATAVANVNNPWATYSWKSIKHVVFGSSLPPCNTETSNSKSFIAQLCDDHLEYDIVLGYTYGACTTPPVPQKITIERQRRGVACGPGTPGSERIGLTEEEISKGFDVAVFPNPVNGSKVTLELSGTEQAQVQVFDVRGVAVYSTQATEGQQSLDLSQLPAGMYQLVATEGQQRVTSRFVKQ